MNHYTDLQIDTLLNGWFRGGPRPKPFPEIAHEMGIDDYEGLDDLKWKLITGYAGKDPRGPRREYNATSHRVGRAGEPWTGRDDDALVAALAGEGQLRDPACDTTYIAAILARSVGEVEARWEELRPGRTGEGFGLENGANK